MVTHVKIIEAQEYDFRIKLEEFLNVSEIEIVSVSYQRFSYLLDLYYSALIIYKFKN